MNLFPFRRDHGDKMDADVDDVIEGEREAAMSNRGLRVQNKATNLLIVASVVTVAGLALWRYYAAVYDRHMEAVEPVREMAAALASLPPLKPPAFPEARQEPGLPAVSASPTQANVQVNPTGQPGAPSGATSTPPALTPAQQRMKQRLQSPLAFKVAEIQAAKVAGGDMITAPAGAAAVGADGPARVKQPSHASGARAYMLADPSMMITQGTKIPCNVIEALDTTLPGLVTCMQTEDVRSADGKVVLLERGTKWVGQQANGIAQGQRRVGIVWSRGETPNHVLVDVDSGGADWLGRPGIAGDVDSHF
jgi:type IV secretion system protein VirB10